MANFCGGDFYSFPVEGSASSNCSGRRGNSSQQQQSRAGSGGNRSDPHGQGVSQWGRQQLSSYAGPSSTSKGGVPGAGTKRGTQLQGGWTGGNWQSEGAMPNRTAIQDLSPHLGNTVSCVAVSYQSVLDYCTYSYIDQLQ